MDTTRVAVTDVFGGTCEELEFRERVVCVALDHGHLVVATASQCSVYNVQSWNTPHIFDLRSAPNLVLLSERCVY
jgi:intraflagellar transport protein 80